MSRFPRSSAIFAALALVTTLGPAACERVPLLAPTGTVINLTLASDIAALNSSVDVIAVLIENGGSAGTGTGTASTTTAAGTPVQNGTVVSFTTTIGTIEPAEARTENGKVVVKLLTNGQSGKATVTAYSGGAKSTAQITIGAAAVDHILTTASPASLSSNGGDTTISARVEDASGNGLSGVQVVFSTTNGKLSSAAATTGSSGVATVTLNTTATADVTATVGAKTGTAKVTVATKSTLQIAVTSTTNVVSTPVSFSVTPGSTAAVSNVVVNYGDNGPTYQLGSPSTAQTVQHFYSSTGIFTVTVTGVDPDGVTVSAQTQIAITGLSATLGASTSTPTTGSSVVFTASVTPSSAVIYHYEWDFGDDTSATTDGNQVSHIYTSTGRKTVTVKVVPYYGRSNADVTVIIQINVS